MNIRHKVIDQEYVDAKDAWGIDIKSKRGKVTSKAVHYIKTFNFIYICHGNFDISQQAYLYDNNKPFYGLITFLI